MKDKIVFQTTLETAIECVAEYPEVAALYAAIAQAEQLKRIADALELLVGKRGIVHTANTQAE